MAQQRDIRRRITSIKKTQQVTRAMKMVAAAKLRRAQQAILQARPYAGHLREMISWIFLSQDLPAHPLLKKPDGNTLHLLIITGERGLCGGFNSNIFREVANIHADYDGPIKMTVIGKKGIEHFKRRNYKLHLAISDLDKNPLLSIAQTLAEELSGQFISNQCQKVAITYTEFQSALTQRVVTEWLLPLEFDIPPDLPMNLDYLFHPSPSDIVNQLLPRYVYSQIYRSLLESRTSEFGARMTAMDSATRNSEEMISNLTLQYNRARQAAITKELIEIVSGSEALKE